MNEEVETYLKGDNMKCYLALYAGVDEFWFFLLERKGKAGKNTKSQFKIVYTPVIVLMSHFNVRDSGNAQDGYLR